PGTNPCVVPSGSKPGHTRPTRRRLDATGATAASTRPARRRRTAPTTTLPAAFSPIPTTPIIVGEGEPPPSWDPVPTPK
ncbi:hypothetical protein ACJX0J_016728, partial [Zea mays]